MKTPLVILHKVIIVIKVIMVILHKVVMVISKLRAVMDMISDLGGGALAFDKNELQFS